MLILTLLLVLKDQFEVLVLVLVLVESVRVLILVIAGRSLSSLLSP